MFYYLTVILPIPVFVYYLSSVFSLYAGALGCGIPTGTGLPGGGPQGPTGGGQPGIVGPCTGLPGGGPQGPAGGGQPGFVGPGTGLPGGHFLFDRSKRVVSSNTASTFLPVTSGVTQGSVLGPVLILIYINDIVDLFDRSDVRVKL